MKGKKTDEDEQRDKAHTCTQLSIDSTNSFPQAVFPIISQLNQNKLNKKQAVCLSVCPSVSPGLCELAGRENHRYGDWTRNTGCLVEFCCQDQRTQYKRSVTGPLSHSVSSELHLLNLNQTTSCTEKIKLVMKVLSSLNPQ